MADGPVIQRASERALGRASGSDVLAMVAQTALRTPSRRSC
jgi:tryptophan synthase alpha subunit